MCLGTFFQSLCHLLDARDELFHLGCFFVDDFEFQSHCIFGSTFDSIHNLCVRSKVHIFVVN